MKIHSLSKVIILSTAVLFAANVSSADGDRKTLDVTKSDTLASVLKKQADKTVTLKMVSGQDITGKLQSVGDHVVYISRIRGIEYYDAVIDLDDILAMVVRVKN